MPRPVTPTLTPYGEQLPDVNDPSSWATRTPLFWNWVTGAGYSNMDSVVSYGEAVSDYLDAALVDSETVVDAVAALQTLLNNCILTFRGAIAAIPVGWQLCDGTNGTPDLRDKFIVGAGAVYAVGNTGGANTVTLTEGQMPSHNHFFNANTSVNGDHTHQYSQASNYVPVPNQGSATWGYVDSGPSNSVRNTGGGGNHTHNVHGNTNSKGGNQAHENRPPYYALAYIAKV